MPLYSLKNQRSFDLVNSCGRKKSGSYFILIIAKNFNLIKADSENPTFLGMKVSKKLSKKAYIRNKIKRRIRHLTRIMLKDKDLDLSNLAIIFIPYKNFEKVKFSMLTMEYKKLLGKI